MGNISNANVSSYLYCFNNKLSSNNNNNISLDNILDQNSILDKPLDVKKNNDIIPYICYNCKNNFNNNIDNSVINISYLKHFLSNNIVSDINLNELLPSNNDNYIKNYLFYKNKNCNCDKILKDKYNNDFNKTLSLLKSQVSTNKHTPSTNLINKNYSYSSSFNEYTNNKVEYEVNNMSVYKDFIKNYKNYKSIDSFNVEDNNISNLTIMKNDLKIKNKINTIKKNIMAIKIQRFYKRYKINVDGSPNHLGKIKNLYSKDNNNINTTKKNVNNISNKSFISNSKTNNSESSLFSCVLNNSNIANNVSYNLREDKFNIKYPPDLYKNKSSHLDNISSSNINKANANSCKVGGLSNIGNYDINIGTSYDNKSINNLKYKINDTNNCFSENNLYLANNSNINLSNISCKYYKMKKENIIIKHIKKYLSKNFTLYNQNSLTSIDNLHFGIKLYSNKSKVVGFYNNNNEAHILAYYHCYNNIIYKGEFLNNLLNGFGFSLGNNDCSYVGEWVKSKQEGLGFELWKSGSFYKGSFSNGKKFKIGTYYWKNGAYYKGEWDKNKMDGYVSKLLLLLLNIINYY